MDAVAIVPQSCHYSFGGIMNRAIWKVVIGVLTLIILGGCSSGQLMSREQAFMKGSVSDGIMRAMLINGGPVEIEELYKYIQPDSGRDIAAKPI
jgi:hypothetical protein